MSHTAPDSDARLADRLIGLQRNPLEYVMFAFPWDEDPELQVVDWYDESSPSYEALAPYRERFDTRYGPDAWQCEYLDELGEAIRNNGFDGSKPVPPVLQGRASGHGIGKSALTGMLVAFFMQTAVKVRMVITASTVPQLETRTWPEICKWFSKSIGAHWFEWSETGLWLAHRSRGSRWRADAQTARKENSEAFQGLHNATSRTVYLCDESSAIPDEIFDVIRGSLSDGECFWIMFGNPTRRDGYFSEAMFGREAHKWLGGSIDSRAVAVTNKERIAELLDSCGGDEDHDFFRVRVRGKRPRAGSMQLIGEDLVTAGQTIAPRSAVTDPIVCGLDVARSEGASGAETVFTFRKGRDARTYPTVILRTRDTTEIAAKAAELEHQFRAWGTPIKRWFVDGGGIGGPIIDMMRKVHNIPGVIEVHNNAASPDDDYFDLVSYCWAQVRDWLAAGGAIDDDRLLAEQLTNRDFGYREHKGRMTLQIESKQILCSPPNAKPSPDRADSLALTFAAKVAPVTRGEVRRGGRRIINDFDPYGEN